MRANSRSLQRHLLALVLLSSLPYPLVAQAIDGNCKPGAGLGGMVEGKDVADLPVDRIADILALEPGVTSLDQGDLSVRGAGTGALGVYLDGVPVHPGHRGGSPILGGSYFGNSGVGVSVGTNAFDHLSLYPGVAAAELAGTRGGALVVSARGICSTSQLRGGLATDAIFGTSNGLGFNRATMDGSLSRGKLSLGGAAVFEGLKSERLGLGQNRSPVFVAGGIDTSVTFDPGGGPTTVDITRFRESNGIRIPSSANSAYTLNAYVGYQVGAGQEIRLSAYASQQQDRLFDYQNLYNRAQTLAKRAYSRMVTGGWFGRLKQSAGLVLNGEGHLSWQTDRIIGGPLSASGERDTRSPFGGFLVAPVDFLYTFDNFAVNDELVRNFRTNSGRLSPYDIKNPDQYSLVDIYRNNAYGLTGFSETGGPVGRLTLSKENRLVAKAVVDASFAERHRLRVGAEITHYDVDFYQSQLTSQALANAYIESPNHLALFGDYHLRLGLFEASAGARYDRFKSGASRPDFPRISSAPGFDPAHPTADFIEDQSHSRVSPSLQLGYQATPMLRVTGGIAKVAQLPDFALLFAGINTDIQTTTIDNPYGTDLDFEHATVGQLGAQVQLTPRLSADANLWYRKDEDIVTTRLVQQLDPSKNSIADIVRYQNSAELKTTGLDFRLNYPIGSQGRAWLSYTFTDSKVPGPDAFASNDADVVATGSRPHTLAGAVLYQTGSGVRALGGLLKHVGVYGAFRVASGTAYTRCAALSGNESVLSDEFCNNAIVGDINAARLPTLKLVDLRLTRGLNFGATQLVAFVDARNLLNSRNVVRVFTTTGKTSNPVERDLVRSGNLAEFANESDVNGVRQPNGDMNLGFGGVTDPRAACGNWTNAAGNPNVPNCVYLINAEERFGNGDHVFTLAEQTRASDALYQVARGLQNFTGPGRRVRIGLELRL